MVKIGSAQCGTVCSERPLNALDLKAFRTSRTHGVQGVECSNHSVPTNNPNDLATYGWLFHFCVWGLFRDIIRFSSSVLSAPAHASPLLIPCSQPQSAFPAQRRSNDW